MDVITEQDIESARLIHVVLIDCDVLILYPITTKQIHRQVAEFRVRQIRTVKTYSTIIDNYLSNTFEHATYNNTILFKWMWAL